MANSRQDIICTNSGRWMIRYSESDERIQAEHENTRFVCWLHIPLHKINQVELAHRLDHMLEEHLRQNNQSKFIPSSSFAKMCANDIERDWFEKTVGTNGKQAAPTPPKVQVKSPNKKLLLTLPRSR